MYCHIMAPASRRLVELNPCSPEDPDVTRTATVLSAYFHAEHMRTFRRLLWRRLVLAAILWLIVARLLASKLRSADIFAGLVLIVAAGVWTALLEWRAERRLCELLDTP